MNQLRWQNPGKIKYKNETTSEINEIAIRIPRTFSVILVNKYFRLGIFPSF